MTDNEIIKGLECCKTANCSDCKGCPYNGKSDSTRLYVDCCNLLITDALDLINRQKAEIERLEDKTKRLKESVRLMLNYDDGDERIKAEAVKEFAERLKENKIDIDVSFGYGREHYTEAVAVVEIDHHVKEFTEGKADD